MSHRGVSSSDRENVKIFSFRSGPDHCQDGPVIQFISDPLRKQMKLVPGYNSRNNWESRDSTVVGSKMSKVLRSLSSLEAGEQTSLTLKKYIQRIEVHQVTPDVEYILSDIESSRY